ncbi:type IV toxin-antitoxin system AbiEi family antitoxin domain-containing protein [Sporichthya polymorpha]|uniref:type IV toxin-antitoxin system AbiEi family antitoxin domain-containing protein n=1 Tax=Sporichthya polymorpha TaxID=35751 RepID=UPI00039DF048|nr:type IV toxin-antitoxin system AbiEi family antitoxin domain-containing protein [Sporichthya polymorpha]
MAPVLPRALGETFRFTEALAAGLSEPALRELVELGRLEQVARGLFRRANAQLADLDQIEIASKAPMATLCLTSALVHHELSDDIPAVIDIALPRGAWHPKVSAPVRWHSFAVATFELERGQIELDSSTSIGVYGPRRSIVDAFRLDYQIGPEAAVEALRRWLRGGGNSPASLMEMARNFPRTEAKIRGVLQVLL